MLTLKREAARVDWIQEDIHITRHAGPPLAHTIPSLSELTSADIAIVHYLQEQGLWRHNVTIRSARAALNNSPHAAKQVRLAHIVKWMKRHGDNPPEDRVMPKNGNQGNAEGNTESKRVTPRSEEGNARVTPPETINPGKRYISPP